MLSLGILKAIIYLYEGGTHYVVAWLPAGFFAYVLRCLKLKGSDADQRTCLDSHCLVVVKSGEFTINIGRVCHPVIGE
jgi:hypothetical protein